MRSLQKTPDIVRAFFRHPSTATRPNRMYGNQRTF
jgi:hypothetical protein